MQVVALPLPHRPLFPGFYMPIYVKVCLRIVLKTQTLAYILMKLSVAKFIHILVTPRTIAKT